MRYQGIKITLITGFLGAGKTTLIRQLLEQAPPHERWAVLVNEFGDIGLDSAFYSESGVAVKEVPGGCVCCTTSAAFQQGLNQLIRQYNPDRIFIEPSGLGHPKQIIQKLRSDSYQDVLLLTGAFCVLDARNLKDERYTKHDIFKDQIESANGIVLSHVDRYQQEDRDRLADYFTDVTIKQPKLFMSNPMTLNLDDLDIGLNDAVIINSNSNSIESEHPHGEHLHDHHSHTDHLEHRVGDRDDKEECAIDLPWHYQKQQDAMQVLGWKWSEGHYFDEGKVNSLILTIADLDGIYRIKGVFLINTTEALLVNVSRGEITLSKSKWCGASRMEIIGDIESDWANRIDIQGLE